ncbi:hypothetical protein LXL04_016094 [Taraxacum kok-saghyz]
MTEEEEMSKLEKVQLAIKHKEVQTILKHVKGERPLYRLIPRASFSTTNSVDEQPNFLIYMIHFYIHENAKEDFEVTKVFNFKVPDPNDTTENISDLRDGTILNDPWAIVYKTYYDRKYQNKIFYLNEKHRYSMSNLNTVIAKMEVNPRNKTANKKHIINTVKWWIMLEEERTEDNTTTSSYSNKWSIYHKKMLISNTLSIRLWGDVETFNEENTVDFLWRGVNISVEAPGGGLGWRINPHQLK